MEETAALELLVDRYALGAFVAYLVIIIGLGIWSSRFSSRGVGHFFVGGRKINRVVVALSAVIPEAASLPAEDTENLFPVLAQEYLHPVLFGAVIASIMSTADSQLLVAASSVVRDVYEKIWKRGLDVPQRKLVFISRVVVGLIVTGAVLFGIFAEDLVFWLVLFAWAGLGAAIGPTAILALYWRRTTGPGVIAGFIAGATVTIVWYLVPVLNDLIYELVPGFAAGLLVTIVVSLLTRPPEQTREHFLVMQGKSSHTNDQL